MLGMLPCTLTPDEEKSTYASLAQENCFSPVHLVSLARLVNGAWYVTLHMKIRRREVNIRQFGSRGKYVV